jgi:hypothetical protein
MATQAAMQLPNEGVEMSRSFGSVAAVVVTSLVFLGGCATGPTSRNEVCEQFDKLGRYALSANGVIDNRVFYTADDLADTAKRYSGPENLSGDASLLSKIADSSSTDDLELANATTHIADLCGHPLGMSTLLGGSRGQNASGGTAATPTRRPQTPTYTPQDPVTSTETTTRSDDFRRVEGPAGLSVAIPETFQLTASPSAANQQAADPANPDAFLRFGGSAAPKATLRAEIEAGERTNPNVRAGYQRVQLTNVTFQGTTAVDWEFTFVKDGRTRHAYGRYWRVGGTGYVVYGSAPVDKWDSLLPAFNHMLASAVTAR